VYLGFDKNLVATEETIWKKILLPV
jgi:hypothetical protein